MIGTTVFSGALWLLGSLVIILASNIATNYFSRKGVVRESICKERRDSNNILLAERHNELVKKIDHLTSTIDNVLCKKD